jgi:hypothetical protein
MKGSKVPIGADCTAVYIIKTQRLRFASLSWTVLVQITGTYLHGASYFATMAALGPLPSGAILGDQCRGQVACGCTPGLQYWFVTSALQEGPSSSRSSSFGRGALPIFPAMPLVKLFIRLLWPSSIKRSLASKVGRRPLSQARGPSDGSDWLPTVPTTVTLMPVLGELSAEELNGTRMALTRGRKGNVDKH